MLLDEFIDKVLALKAKLVSEGRDPHCINVYHDIAITYRRPVYKIETKDDGSGCDNLDVYIQ